MIRVTMVISGISRLNGGVSEALAGLVGGLRGLPDLEVSIVTLWDRHFDEDRAAFEGTNILPCPSVGPHRFRLSFDMGKRIAETRPDIVHLHGLWGHPSVHVAKYARNTGAPYIVSPHGMADPWILAKSRPLKQAMLAVNERALLAGAAVAHGLCLSEETSIKALAPDVETRLLPNGVTPLISREEAMALKAATETTRFLYFGRIDPKKNVDGVVRGWRAFFAACKPNAALEIIGWGPAAYRQEIEQTASECADMNVALGAPIYGAEKYQKMASADFLILPSFSEGLPLVPLEGWSVGTPSLLSRGCNLEETFATPAALETGVAPAEIAAAFETAYELSAEQRRQAQDASFQLAREQFSWDVIARDWRRVYEDIAAR